MAQGLAFLVTRAQHNLQFRCQSSRPVDKSMGLRADPTIVLTGANTAPHYPQLLRRIPYFDSEHHRRLVFLTNNFTLSALTITAALQSSLADRIVLKWIKQHLRIKAFYGTSENAVKTQIWIAVSVYVLVAILKKRLESDLPLHTILQILSLSLLEKMPLLQALTESNRQNYELDSSIQLNLFNL